MIDDFVLPIEFAFFNKQTDRCRCESLGGRGHVKQRVLIDAFRFRDIESAKSLAQDDPVVVHNGNRQPRRVPGNPFLFNAIGKSVPWRLRENRNGEQAQNGPGNQARFSDR